jgi:hypothetical protein
MRVVTATSPECLDRIAIMSLLVEERTRLGDHEPILVNRFFIPRRLPTVKPLAVRPVKRRLVPAENRAP